jgi:hypothetical protein
MTPRRDERMKRIARVFPRRTNATPNDAYAFIGEPDVSALPDDIAEIHVSVAIYKSNVGVAYAWEPVIVRGGRKRTRAQKTIKDWIGARANITLRKGIVGAKPENFVFWLYEVWNACEGDAFDEFYPGTGVMGKCWERFMAERSALEEGKR